MEYGIGGGAGRRLGRVVVGARGTNVLSIGGGGGMEYGIGGGAGPRIAVSIAFVISNGGAGGAGGPAAGGVVAPVPGLTAGGCVCGFGAAAAGE
jgi:hypothetical protein